MALGFIKKIFTFGKDTAPEQKPEAEVPVVAAEVEEAAVEPVSSLPMAGVGHLRQSVSDIRPPGMPPALAGSVEDAEFVDADTRAWGGPRPTRGCRGSRSRAHRHPPGPRAGRARRARRRGSR